MIITADPPTIRELVAQNKVARIAIQHEARRLFQALPQDAAATVPLPEGQPARREAYRAVNAVAHSCFGPRAYRMSQTAAGVEVRRTAGRGVR